MCIRVVVISCLCTLLCLLTLLKWVLDWACIRIVGMSLVGVVVGLGIEPYPVTKLETGGI